MVSKENGPKPGDIYYSPYKKPSQKPPDGYKWRVSERHFEKNYPLKWELVPIPKVKGKENKRRTDLSPKERGNYTADIVAKEMEKREEEKERNMRRAMGLPDLDD